MKDDRVCEYCTYKNVPTHFSPCLGCKEGRNKDNLDKKKDEESEV